MHQLPQKGDQGKEQVTPVRCGDCHVKRFEALTLKYPVVEFDFAYHDKHVKTLKEKKGKDECGACHHTYDHRKEDESLRLVYEKGRRSPAITAMTLVRKEVLSCRR